MDVNELIILIYKNWKNKKIYNEKKSHLLNSMTINLLHDKIPNGRDTMSKVN